MENKTGTEAIEGVLEVVKDLAIAYAEIKKDGEVNMDDLPVAIGLVSKLGGMIESIKAIGEIKDEAKDIDATEAVALVSKIYALGKEVEEAFKE